MLLVLTTNGLHGQALKEETLRQIQILQAEKAARTPVQRKITSQLLQGIREARGEKIVEGVDLEPVNLPKDSRGNVEVDIATTAPMAVAERIKTLGGNIIFASEQFNTLRAAVPLVQVEAIAALPEVRFIEPAAPAQTVGNNGSPLSKGKAADTGPLTPSIINKQRPAPAERKNRIKRVITKYLQQQEYNPLVFHIGNVNSQADAAHGADKVRNRYGAMGQGIKIGVLSDSYNALGGAAADVSNGELPGTGNPYGNTTPVTVVQDITGGADEGRAMLQLIHDIAPKAQLFYATADEGQASFANNILQLRNTYHCDIIVDDILYLGEPAFQDGIIAQAVNTVTADGALYFSAAFNSGSVAKGTTGVWEGDFNNVGSPAFNPGYAGTIHNFGTTTSPVNGDIITAKVNFYSLKWADPIGASNNDYDLFLLNASGSLVAYSNSIQNGAQDPYEAISASDLSAGDRLVVFKDNVAAIRAFRLDAYKGRLTVVTTGQTYGHSSAVEAYSVAATPAARASNPAITPVGPYPGVFTTASQVEAFSSEGLRRIFYNADGSAITPGNFLFGTNGGTVRRKPDITAADGASTTVPNFQPF